MKKVYEAPTLEIEIYELDASIASNCKTVVTMGPEASDAQKVCDDYYEKSGEPRTMTAAKAAYNIEFWESCDCYYSANGTFFTS